MEGDLLQRYFPLPWVASPRSADSYSITAANGNMVAMCMWPPHPPEETEAATAATYIACLLLTRTAMP